MYFLLPIARRESIVMFNRGMLLITLDYVYNEGHFGQHLLRNIILCSLLQFELLVVQGCDTRPVGSLSTDTLLVDDYLL